jgi:hypothetical protein
MSETVWEGSLPRSGLLTKTIQLLLSRPLSAERASNFRLESQSPHPGVVRAILHAPPSLIDQYGNSVEYDRIQVTGQFSPVGAPPVRLRVERFQPNTDGGAAIIFQSFMGMRGTFEITVLLCKGDQSQEFVVSADSTEPRDAKLS